MRAPRPEVEAFVSFRVQRRNPSLFRDYFQFNKAMASADTPSNGVNGKEALASNPR